VITEWLKSLFAGAELEMDRGSLLDFERQALDLAQRTGRSGAEVLRDQTRLLIHDLMTFTPPFGRVPFLEGIDKQFFIGKAAVRRDIRRVFRPVQTLRAWRQPVNGRVKRELERAVRRGDTATVARILSLQESRVLPRVTPALHQQARDGKGRVPASFRWYVVLDDRSVREYEEEVFTHIGRAKAGWETAARALGVPVPEWIGRHSTPGRFRQVEGPDGPSIEIANDVEYGGDFDELQILEKALARRQRSMEDQLNAAIGRTFASLS
jgi:hypothetical protein